MAVEVLRLTGVDGGDGRDAADALLADFGSHPDLSRLLVIDDTGTLIAHSPVYERLLTSRRLDHLLCVAVGPLTGAGPRGRRFEYPANIGSGQGSALLWVGDPGGIDWEMAAAAIAKGHPANSVTGLDHLIGLLTVDEVFDQVCETTRQVPGGVASPGLRLTGAGDEAAAFAAALALAIRRIIAADPAQESAMFTELADTRQEGVGLAENGELYRWREDVVDTVASARDALTQLASVGGLLRRDQAEARECVIAAGNALSVLRERVIKLLKDANAKGELSEKQRDQLRAAGVRLPAIQSGDTSTASAEPFGAAGAEPSAVFLVIAESIRGGDTLPRVSRRLSLTGSATDHGGSAGYLPDVDRACPESLVRELTRPPDPPPSPRWPIVTGVLAMVLGVVAGTQNAAAGIALGVAALAIVAVSALWWWRGRVRAWENKLALDSATPAAHALAELTITVAAREWSQGGTGPAEITRARIALDGIAGKLAEHAGTAQRSGTRSAHVTRISEGLLPRLRELVLNALTIGISTTGAGGQAAFDRASARTEELLAEWARHARQHGLLSAPPFAAFTADEPAYTDTSETAGIAEAIQYDAREVMWQLCAPDDLSALAVAGAPAVVAFAPRLARQALAAELPQDTVWTYAGTRSGLLRLVPLRDGIGNPRWSDSERD